MYLLGIKAKYPELVEVCGHTIRPQNRNSPRELAYSEDFILSCVDKCRELNNYQGLQQFIDVYETVGNVIPVWPGGMFTEDNFVATIVRIFILIMRKSGITHWHFITNTQIHICVEMMQ